VALTVLEKKIFNDLAISLPVWKIFGILESSRQNLNRPTQGTSQHKISFLGVVVSEEIYKPAR
jgi:hypothetical protein